MEEEYRTRSRHENQLYLDIGYTEMEEENKTLRQESQVPEWRSDILFGRLHSMGVVLMGPGARLPGVSLETAISSL